MIVGGQKEARASTIIDYHGSFDQGLKLHFNIANLEAMATKNGLEEDKMCCLESGFLFSSFQSEDKRHNAFLGGR